MDQSITKTNTAITTSNFMGRVYAWMAVGLVLTAYLADVVASSPALSQLVLGNKAIFVGLLIVQFALVVALEPIANRRRRSGGLDPLVFLAYSAIQGVTMSLIFHVYTTSSIASIFVIAAGMFGAMSLYGTVTKRDLAPWGNFLFMGVIGILIALLVNLFMQSEMVAWITSVAGVIVFAGLTAYDTQKIREMGVGEGGRPAVVGALILYLDFILLFKFLLRLLGERQD